MEIMMRQRLSTESRPTERRALAMRSASPIAAACLAALGALAACGDDAGPADMDGGIDPSSPAAVRAYINDQIPGGTDKLKVPAADSGIPVPPAPLAYPGRFDTTEAKRYLGKLLFHDPIRTQRVNVNK